MIKSNHIVCFNLKTRQIVNKQTDQSNRKCVAEKLLLDADSVADNLVDSILSGSLVQVMVQQTGEVSVKTLCAMVAW